jgi:PASTA domain
MRALWVAVTALGVVVVFAGPSSARLLRSAGSPQSITVMVHAPSTATYPNAFGVQATSSSGLPVTYTSSGACTNSGAAFTMTSGTGTCQVKYDQPGNATYDPAPQVVEIVSAQKANQTISFESFKEFTYGDPDFDVAAFATSDLAVVFTATGGCTVSGATIHITAAGPCTITASQPGDANYNAATPVSQTLTIAKESQDILFDQLRDKFVDDPDFKVKAQADSTLPISYRAKGKCIVKGNIVHLVAVGKCTITASQSGNENWKAAQPVSESFAIAPAPCRVPKLVGKRLAAAQAALKRNHCRTGAVHYIRSSASKDGIVLRQKQRPGRIFLAGSSIGLVVGRGP